MSVSAQSVWKVVEMIVFLEVLNRGCNSDNLPYAARVKSSTIRCQVTQPNEAQTCDP